MHKDILKSLAFSVSLCDVYSHQPALAADGYVCTSVYINPVRNLRSPHSPTAKKKKKWKKKNQPQNCNLTLQTQK